MAMNWQQRYAERTQRMTSSAIRDLLKVTEQPDFISFAGGLPAPEVFPVAEVAAAAQRILRAAGPQALQYGATEGYRPLRELIAKQMCADGVPVGAENVLITTGSQQALDLIGKVFLDPGDRVLVESPTYLAALQAWTSYGAYFAQTPADNDGVRTDEIEPRLREQPKFLYCLPNFQNPAGTTLSAPRRDALVALAQRYGVPIIEDDPYRALRFEGEHLPRLITLDAAKTQRGGPGKRRGSQESHYQGNVLYLSTCSKILSPGLRVGWIVGPAAVIGKLAQAKQGVDLHTAMFNQMLVYDLLESGFVERHTPVIVGAYRERRDAMLAALRERFPAEARWTEPDGGMFLWVTLPHAIDATDLLQEAIAERVAFVPGAAFHANGGGANTLRLNFSNATPEQIREGIARLGRALSARLAAPISA